MPSRVNEFHEGEAAMHAMLKVPGIGENPTSPGFPMPYAMRVMQSPLVAVGTLDQQGRPWTTVWGGERGFARPIAQGVLGINSSVDTAHDPVFQAFWAGSAPDAEVVRPEAMMAALSIDLETRDRVKLAGRMIAAGRTGTGEDGGGVVQAAIHVMETLGNCPKYLNKREIVPHKMEPQLVAEGLPLSEDAVRLIAKSDMFFLSTTNGDTMDTNHRGGPPGFVRVMRNDDGGVSLVYPEFSGNRLYQSLGNLKINPLIGMTFADFDTSDVLYLTGSASILFGQEATSLLPRTQLALKIDVASARFVRSGLPFRGSFIDYSPYNPPLRVLQTEHDSHIASEARQPDLTASLVNRERLTPTISRFTFRLSGNGRWHAGQYVTLDFGDELDMGYAHMNDADPQSLNDDYVRTFTISSVPEGSGGKEIKITARKHGPATGLLWSHQMRIPLDLPVLGFGGEEAFRMPLKIGDATTPTGREHAGQPVFIAAGVGVTPLLAQAQGVLDSGVKLRVLWSIRSEDLPLVKDTFDRIAGLASVTTLYVTGRPGDETIDGIDVPVERRRMASTDVAALKKQGRKFFLCTGPALLKALNEWLEGEDVVWEDFGY